MESKAKCLVCLDKDADIQLKCTHAFCKDCVKARLMYLK